MKVKYNLFEIMATIVFSPLLILLYFTKGRYLSEQEINHYIIKSFSVLADNIKSFLDIETIPDIGVVYNNAAVETKYTRLLGRYRVTYLINSNPEIGYNRIIKGNTLFNFISLYPYSIMNSVYSHNLFGKIKIIHSLVHELTHHKQNIEGKFHGSTANESESYIKYRENKNETEARRLSNLFIVTHIFKIIKLAAS